MACRQNRRYPETGFVENNRRKVKSPSPPHRFVIAEYSPEGVVETGLPIRLAEKSAGSLGRVAERASFFGPVSYTHLTLPTILLV